MTTPLTPPDGQPPNGPDLRPPDSDTHPFRGPGLRRILLIAFFVFTIVDLAILAYIFLFWEGDRQPAGETGQPVINTPQVKPVPKPEPPSEDPQEHTSSAAARKQWLQVQAEAEAGAVRSWAESEFQHILDQATKAEKLWTEGEFKEAEKHYQQAAQALKALTDERPQRLTRTLQEGEKALQNDDKAGAGRAFDLALALDPDNARAIKGRARARTLGQVTGLRQKASAEEKKGDLEQAGILFKQAIALDPEDQKSRTGLARVQSGLEDRQFRRAMGNFLQELQEGRPVPAARHLAEARSLRPAAPAVADAEQQLNKLKKRLDLQRLEQQFHQRMHNEEWQQARQLCEQALKIDPHAAFALTGLRRADQLLEQEETLRAILDRPERLQDQGPRQEAKQVVLRAQSLETQAPGLLALADQVNRRIQQMERLIPLVIESDEQTDITIYRVGRLGRFSRRELTLHPGTYTIVGSRPGYRDVRRSITIEADAQTAGLRIFCSETI